MTIVKYGRYVSNVSGTINTMTKVFDPSVNEAGAVIRTLTLSINGNGAVWLHTGPTTPVQQDVNSKIVFRVDGNSSMLNSRTMPYEVELPPSYGLWIYTSSAQSSGVNMSYDLY
ncbi:hypothetical protein [Azospirillum argentinense]|uniref:hypothetical protein n=1 Tax=Azospirillum argentinense TaxID=2970906 RepID=UPI0032DFAE1F